MAQQFLAPSERKVMKAQDNSVLSFGTASVVLTLLSQLLKPERQQLSGEETLTQQGSFPIKYYISALKTSSIKFPALEVQSSPESLFSLRWWTLLFTAPNFRLYFSLWNVGMMKTLPLRHSTHSPMNKNNPMEPLFGSCQQKEWFMECCCVSHLNISCAAASSPEP